MQQTQDTRHVEERSEIIPGKKANLQEWKTLKEVNSGLYKIPPYFSKRWLFSKRAIIVHCKVEFVKYEKSRMCEQQHNK